MVYNHHQSLNNIQQLNSIASFVSFYFSHDHGGKDGHPFPVDRDTYDKSISVLLDAVRKARMGYTEKTDALKRLAKLGS